ncbi:MAG: hypothetical protein ACR2H1_04595 [Limisphaerales bacterium]
MKNKIFFSIVITLLLAAHNFATAKKTAKKDSWQETMQGEDKEFLSTGRNQYFILEPGHQLTLEGEEDGKQTKLIITVLDETKKVDGVETRIIEERESQDGELIEVSRNYFAIGKESKSVYYFGEEVDMYKKGKITSHEGAWESGVKGAKYGLMISGKTEIGAKYYQERAPKVAMDRGENVSTSETSKTPAGEFKNCLKVKETSALESGTEYKLYAPEVGLVKEGELKLVKHGSVKK